MAVPKVFISYSWDGAEHQRWVQNLAARLREHGVETILDVWSVAPGEELPGFMETSVRESDFVLIVCTPKYKDRADNRKGGVGYEGSIMTAEVFTHSPRRKFIPVLRHPKWEEAAPSWLLGSRYLNLTEYPEVEDGYHELLDALHDRRAQPPPVGMPPKRPDREKPNTINLGTGVVSSAHTIREVSQLIAKIHARTEPLAASIASALHLAAAMGDVELQSFCECELAGYGHRGLEPDSEVFAAIQRILSVKTDNIRHIKEREQQEAVEHRRIQFYISIGQEIDINYFGSGANAITYMERHPKEFVPARMIYPNPISEVERQAARANAMALVHIEQPARVLSPNMKAPDMPVHFYASGDCFSKLVDTVRTELTAKLLRHARPKR